LIASGKYRPEELLDYEHIDLTAAGTDPAMRERDEFNFSANIQFGQATIAEVRGLLRELTAGQDDRKLRLARAAGARAN
jgi:hypothetical protein